MDKEKGFLDKVRNYITLGSGNFLASIITAFFWMYIATILDKSEYGLLAFLMSMANVTHGVVSVGLARTIVVYGAKQENIYSATYTIGLISSSLGSIAIYIITQNVGLSFLSWGMMIFLLKTAELNSKSQYLSFAKYRILRSSLAVIFGIGLFHVLGFDGVIIGFALANLPAFVGLYNYVKKKDCSISILKPKINFMITSWGYRLSGMLFWWGDKMVIGAVFGFSALGSYQLAIQYLLLIDTIPRALAMYLLPQESQGKRNKKIKIFSIGVSVLVVIVSIILLPFAIDTFFPDFQESILPAQIMSIAIIPITIYHIFEVQFFGREQPKIPVIGAAIQTACYFMLIILLGTEYGILGIAVGLLISTIIRATYNGIATVTYHK